MDYSVYQQRLINNSLPIGECWEWQGVLKGKDKLRQYGGCTIGSRTNNTRKTISTHRLSYLAFVGEIPDEMFVCHTCDNPRCCNPSHLFLGTRQDNVDDRERKGRNVIHRGSNHVNSKFTDEIILSVKKDILNGVKRKQILEKYKMSITAFKEIKRGRNWKHIIPPPPTK